MGLYWIRPWNFLTLDSQSQCYINKKLNIQIGHNGPKRYCNANDYLSILNTLEIRFDEDAYPVHSFPELSLTAWEESSMLQEIEKDINKFKLRYQDFADFINSGNLYIEEERNYKILATQTAAKMIENFNNASESVNIYFQLIELANFFNWRDKDHLNSLKGSDHFVAGINSLITALKNNKLDEAVFESMRSELKKSGIAANMLLQTVLFPFFLVYPDKYFALKSSLLLKCMRRYGYKGFKKGEYIRYNQFTEIQRFASDIKNQLNKYKPKDMIDIQSFLWIAESYDPGEEIVDNNEEEDTENTLEVSTPIITLKPYTIDNIIEEGCFIEKIRLERIFERLRVKKNLILQGPPGTGKTWLAKRLAYVLIGIKNDEKMKAVQFHPNLSYEDFIRGWRPSGEGRLTLIDGPFLEMINASEKDPNTKHVVVIEEINRGNPAQVFGEMLTLLEVDKRTPSEGLELSYRRNDNERVYIPDNLYVIGTMNIADRSLALVDFALRRRFAFINLRPELGSAWSKWVQEKCNIEPDILERIEKRINSLNNDISADTNLGEQFCIGHSFVTPPFEIEIKDPEDWFRQVVDTEIGPLLDEYWFDALEKAEHAKRRLLEGF
ncbi:MAG: AAA domain-containing protein [bacterium]|nr:AAA domain-containing protein [bacterium]